MTSRKKPGLAFWATVVVVVVLVAYALSFGPWCWIASRCRAPYESRQIACPFYRPILLAWCNGPQPVGRLINWYADLGVSSSGVAAAYDETDGTYTLIDLSN